MACCGLGVARSGSQWVCVFDRSNGKCAWDVHESAGVDEGYVVTTIPVLMDSWTASSSLRSSSCLTLIYVHRV